MIARRSAVAALAIGLSLVQPAVAQLAPSPLTASESAALDAAGIARLAATVEDDVAAAGRSEPTTRIVALRSALSSLAILEATARLAETEDDRGEAAAAARRAVAALLAAGIDRETLSARAVDAATAAIDPATTSPEALTAAFAELDRLSIDIAAAPLRAGAMLSIGAMHRRLGNAERATRYGQLAERVSRSMDRGEARDRVLAAALDLVSASDVSRSLGLTVTTLAGFSDGGRRAAALKAMATAADVRGDDMVARIWRMIATADWYGSADLISAAADAGEDDAAVLLAAALPTVDQQDAALLALGRRQLDRGRAAAGLDTARVILGPDRPRLEAEIALVLAESGYAEMARGLASRLQPSSADPAVARSLARVAGVAKPARPRADDLVAIAAAIRAGSGAADERERAADAVLASTGDLRAALAAVRALTDDGLRAAAFRAIAEAEAARLDAGRLAIGAVPPSGEAAARFEARQLSAAAGLSLLAGDGVRTIAPAFLPPLAELSATADTVRALVPLSEPGVSELSLAGLNRFTQLNRFNSKFLEDVVGTTAREHILKTQGTINPTFIYLTDGIFTARDLLHAIDTSQGDQLVRTGDVYTLRVPLVIGQDATLVLSGHDSPEFRLSADAGAFIVNAGRLFVTDTRLVAWNEADGTLALATYETKHAFRPFVTTWSGSQTYIAASTVIGLGYSAGKSYGLTFSSGPKDGKGGAEALARPTGIIVDTVFRNLYYGFYTYEADDVVVVGNVYEDSVVYGLDPHDRSNRLMMAFNTLYGTQEKHGAIFSRDVRDSVLWGNVSFDNAGSGFMLDRRSTQSLVWANVGIGNAQDGMTVYETPCVLIGANRFEANGRSGIKIRNSWNVLVDGNRVTANAGTGIEAYVADLSVTEYGALRDLHEDPYLAIASFSARDNVIAGSAAAVSARGVSAAAFSGNRFSGQGTAVFDGDLKPLRVNLLRAAGPGRSATVLPDDTTDPSPADAEAAGTLDCPPPGARSSAPRPAS